MTSHSSSPSVLFQAIGSTQIHYEPRDRIKVVGSYAFGKVLGEVKEGVHLETHKRVAIKIYHFARLKKIPGGETIAAKEIAILKSLQHSHVVSAVDEFVNEDRLKHYVVLQYVDGGTLHRLLENAPGKRLPLRQSRHIFKDVAKALEYLREQRIVHRDIKPDNILLTVDGHAYVSDFGVALRLPKKHTMLSKSELAELHGEGSLAFQPPECHQKLPSIEDDTSEYSGRSSGGSPRKHKSAGKEVQRGMEKRGVIKALSNAHRVNEDDDTDLGDDDDDDDDDLTDDESFASPPELPRWLSYPFKVDVWSLGIVLYLMVTGTFPFPNATILSLFRHIAEGNYTVPPDLDDQLVSLIRGMLTVDAATRLPITQVKKHPWLHTDLPKAKPIPIVSVDSKFGRTQEELLTIINKIDHLVCSSSASSSSSSSSEDVANSLNTNEDSDTPPSGSFGDSSDSADDSFASEDHSGDDNRYTTQKSSRRNSVSSQPTSKKKRRPSRPGAKEKGGRRPRCVLL